jgi:hypothetical protein
MNSGTYQDITSQEIVSARLQELSLQYKLELDNIAQILARVTNSSPEQVKPYINTLLQQLLNQQQEHPFYETATTQEWVEAFQEWAASHHHNTSPLSDYAVSRESIYEDERL